MHRLLQLASSTSSIQRGIPTRCLHRSSSRLFSNSHKARDRSDLIVQLSDAEKIHIMTNARQENIRNFSIIAHIDHGKSTLADRLLSYSGNILAEQRESGQVLDKLEVERSRGITVKAQTASIFYRPKEAEEFDIDQSYLQNQIDCPGHVDFAYEVSRSMAACQGALLLVDSSQGIQAQTLANFYIAMEHGLEIIPILTKVDLPHSDPDRVITEMVAAFDVKPEDILRCSAKSGLGVAELFPEIVKRIPAPKGKAKVEPKEPGSIHPTDVSTAPLRALLFDSWYDTHRGVVCLVMIEDGELHKGDTINTYHKSGGPYEVVEVGILTPEARPDIPSGILHTGQVGYIVAGIRSTDEIRLGDTFYSLSHETVGTTGSTKGKVVTQYQDMRRIGLQETKKRLAEVKEYIEPLPGFLPAKSMVYAGLFPSSDCDFTELCDAVEKLTLNDASVSTMKESSGALGSGYRCGFLGMLHMDVFVSRLEQEFGISVITTAPTVPYIAHMLDGSILDIASPAHFPPTEKTDYITEPMVRVSIITPHEYVGALTQLCGGNRGQIEDVKFISTDRALMRYKMPLAEVVVDFYQEIKSISSGYASLDYEPTLDEEADVVKLDIRINGESVDALSTICHRMKSEELGKRMIAKLKENLDRQNFEIVLQCAVAGKILGKERLAPYRKDVLIKSGKLVGGGDITRKKKLLEKQKEGKKKMKAIGNVEVSDKAFLSVLQAQSKQSS